jgi:glycosyltransferase involved in cell wall biosynthesis
MRVCFPVLANELESPSRGGIRRYMFELYRRLCNTAFTEKKEFSYHKKLGGYASFLLGSVLSDFSSYDIIHHLDNRVFLPLKRGKAKTLTTVHDLAVLTRPDLHEDFKDSFLSKAHLELHAIKLSNIMAMKSDFIIVQSTQTKREVLSFGYPEEKVFITPFGVDERFTEEVERKNQETFTIGYVGSFMKKKNVASAIRAVKRIDSEKMIFELWSDPGRLGDPVWDQIGGDSRIRLMGPFADDLIISVYDRFDVLVHPSLHEGFGLPILEGYAREIPVIVFEHAQIPKEISKCAIKVRSEEEMAETIRQIAREGVNESHLRQAREYALGFSWGRTAELTFEAYKKIME